MDRIEGFGMMSMRQRLRGVGGSLLVKSAPGKGTRIQATLPRVLSFADAETASSDGRQPSLSVAL
jgi:signal transduction histidine kinase